MQFKYAISRFGRTDIEVTRKNISFDYRMHWHDCCEIELVVAGSGMQIFNGTEYELRPGVIYMLTPADCHSVHVNDEMTVLGLMYDERFMTPAIYERILARESMGLDHIACLSPKRTAVVENLFESLRFAYENNVFAADAELEEMYTGRLIDCILIELLREIGTSREPEEKMSVKSPVSSAILYLNRHYNEDITLSSVAARAHLSAGYFSELFKSQTGQTFKSYLTGLRMRNACRMLANTDMTVTDICFACGFDSFSNFMRAFKKRYLTSPLKFRADNKSEKMQQNSE